MWYYRTAISRDCGIAALWDCGMWDCRIPDIAGLEDASLRDARYHRTAGLRYLQDARLWDLPTADMLCSGASNNLFLFISRQQNPHFQSALTSYPKVHFWTSIYPWKYYYKHYEMERVRLRLESLCGLASGFKLHCSFLAFSLLKTHLSVTDNRYQNQIHTLVFFNGGLYHLQDQSTLACTCITITISIT